MNGSLKKPSSDVIDIEAVRSQFPALERDTVCFNNASGSLIHKCVIESVNSSLSTLPLELEWTDKRSVHETESREGRYKELSAFVNASPDEIAFGHSTTQLFRNLAQSLRPALDGNSEIIVSTLCHESGISAWVYLARSLGVTIKWWSPSEVNNTRLSIETLKPLLSSKTRLVTCGHVSNILGSINPIRAVADLVHTIPGAMLSVDGVAWAPHRPIDVKALDVDFYCFSWYKVFGPHIAQMFARRSVQDREMSSLNHYFFNPHSLDTKLRLGMNCFELEDSLVHIVRYLKLVRWENVIAQEEVLQETLLAYLRSKPHWYTIFGDPSSDPDLRVSLISFRINGLSSEEVVVKIHDSTNFRLIYGDCYSVRLAHDVLKLPEDGIIRVSLVHYNTVEEIRLFTKTLDMLIPELLLQT